MTKWYYWTKENKGVKNQPAELYLGSGSESRSLAPALPELPHLTRAPRKPNLAPTVFPRSTSCPAAFQFLRTLANFP